KVHSKYIYFAVFYFLFIGNKINMDIDVRLKNISPYHPLTAADAAFQMSFLRFLFSSIWRSVEIWTLHCAEGWVLQLHSGIP
ncbi:hypothetical protein RFY10_09455, partial [Acinetobacter baumannii]|nr:hypothetical protein [Acinetobacter baumannii]